MGCSSWDSPYSRQRNTGNHRLGSKDSSLSKFSFWINCFISHCKDFEFTATKILILLLSAISCCTLNIIGDAVAVDIVFLTNILQLAGNPSFLSILGSRMLFNLKDAGKRGVNEGTNYRSKTVSDIQFEEPVASEGTPSVSLSDLGEAKV